MLNTKMGYFKNPQRSNFVNLSSNQICNRKMEKTLDINLLLELFPTLPLKMN